VNWLLDHPIFFITAVILVFLGLFIAIGAADSNLHDRCERGHDVPDAPMYLHTGSLRPADEVDADEPATARCACRRTKGRRASWAR
jgi:hypothetical protein